MGLFNKLLGKKEKETVYSGDLTLWDLKKGFFVNYFMESWQVKDEFHYDWGNNFDSREFELDNGKEKIFLHVLKESVLKCSISREVSIRSVNSQLKDQIIEYNEPFKSIDFENQRYTLEEKHEAYVTQVGKKGESFLTTWDYVSDDEKKMVTVNRWGKSDIETYKGEVVQEFEFSDIVPVSS